MALLPAAFAGLGLPTEHRMPSSEPLALPPHRTGTAEQNGGPERVGGGAMSWRNVISVTDNQLRVTSDAIAMY